MRVETQAEARQWLLGALKESVLNHDGTISIDINTWNVLNLYLQNDAHPAEPKMEQQNTLDLEILGKAVHNLRWCKGSGIFHNIAHDEHAPRDKMTANWEPDYGSDLKIEYDRLMVKPNLDKYADKLEKTLYGGNP